MRKKIVVLAYGLGNVRSIKNALVYLGVDAEISSDVKIIKKADSLILPGVGAFPFAMKILKNQRLDMEIKEFAESGRSILGICLGMQIMLTEGYEFERENGLGLIAGQVTKIITNQNQYKLPHIAWSLINAKNEIDEYLFNGISVADRKFYFVHSYEATNVNKQNIVASVDYGDNNIIAIVKHNNILGTQFHPEKSGPVGLHFLDNFINHN